MEDAALGVSRKFKENALDYLFRWNIFKRTAPEKQIVHMCTPKCALLCVRKYVHKITGILSSPNAFELSINIRNYHQKRKVLFLEKNLTEKPLLSVAPQSESPFVIL